MHVTFAEDEYLRELQEDRATAIWVAQLSDGRLAYADDHRPGLPHSAWLRLKALCEAGGLWVCSLRLKFRDHWAGTLPNHADGYFFTKVVGCSLFQKESINFLAIGALTGGVVVVEKYQVPELLLTEVEHRPRHDCTHAVIGRVDPPVLPAAHLA